MRALFVIGILLISQFVFAQTATVKWGKDQGVNGEANQVVSVDSAGNMVYATPALLARAKKLLGTVNIYHTFLLYDKMVNTYQIVHTLNHHYASITGYSDGEKKLKQHFIEIDKYGNPLGPDHLINSNEFTEYKSRPGNSKYTQDFMGTVVSANGKLILHVSQNSVHDVNKTAEILYLTVLDEDLKEVWKREVTLGEDDKAGDFGQVFVTNTGKAIFTACYNKTLTNSMLRKEQPFSYKLFEVTADNIRETTIGNGLDVQPVSFIIKELNNGDLIAAGSYYAPTKSFLARSIGLFAAKVNAASFTVTSRDARPYKFTENPGNKTPLNESSLVAEELCLSASGEILLVLKSETGNSRGSTGISAFYFAEISSDAKVGNESVIENKLAAGAYSGIGVYPLANKILILCNKDEAKEHKLRAAYFNYNGKLLAEELFPFKNEYYYSARAESKLSDTAIRIGASPGTAFDYTPIFMYGVLTIK
ncbi:MAG TPA: hypothetical protein VK154_18180 [Chitinophagales bacterium]|nr:hypothetical protein [Chitinophagales bacterium]